MWRNHDEGNLEEEDIPLRLSIPVHDHHDWECGDSRASMVFGGGAESTYHQVAGRERDRDRDRHRDRDRN